MCDVERKVGRVVIIGERGEELAVQYWDKGAEFGATWFSPMHDDHVIMTHTEAKSSIHFADQGNILYSVPGDAGKRSFAFDCAEHMFERLIKKLHRVYLDALADQRQGVPVQCEERG